MDKIERLKSIAEEGKRVFIVEYREKINEVLKIILNLRLSFNVKDQNEVRRFFHSIKGSAGVHGYKRLSQIGKEYEDLVESVKTGNEASHKFFSRLLEGIARVNEYINKEYKKVKLDTKSIYNDYDENKINDEFINNDYLFSIGNGSVLIVDDDISLLNLLDKYLRENGYNIIIVSNPKDVIEIIKEKRIDLILLDINMPEINGFELFYSIKSMNSIIQVVFLTSEDDIDYKTKAFEFGADDYILKPFEIEELEARISKILKQNCKIKKRIYVDKLTGAFSKELFYENFKVAMNYLIERHESFCIAVLDIDGFRVINEKYGYNNGNYILEIFYIRIKGAFTPEEQIYRIDADRFLTLFPNKKQKDTFYLIDSLKKDLKNLEFERDSLKDLKINFSAGIVEVMDYSNTVFELLDYANEALKSAKDYGGDKIFIYKYLHKKMIETAEDKQEAKKTKIVIVEDSKNIVYLVKKRLEELGYEVMYSMDGNTGLMMCQAVKPDILILDLMLPTMDGFEICKILKDNPETEGIDIIVMTSYSRKDYVVKCMEMGVEGFIIKPFSLQELELRINKLLKYENNY